MTDKLLDLSGLTKAYPGVVANDDVSLRIAPGEVHALLGENGAGKSTLVKMIYGLVKPDAGQMQMRGERKIKTLRGNNKKTSQQRHDECRLPPCHPFLQHFFFIGCFLFENIGCVFNFKQMHGPTILHDRKLNNFSLCLLAI